MRKKLSLTFLPFTICLLLTNNSQAGVIEYISKGSKVLIKERKLSKLQKFFKNHNLKTDGKLFNKELSLLKREKIKEKLASSKLNSRLVIESLKRSFSRESFIKKRLTLGNRSLYIFYPKTITDLKQILHKSQLHKEVFLRLNTSKISVKHIDNIVGKINESVMVNFFEKNGWKRLKGEVGRNGIDGLFIKTDKNGHIIDVLIVEAKYNTSNLGKTNFGKQMSKDWLLHKIEELKKAYPNIKEYSEIEDFIRKNNYRAIIWNMNIKNNKMKITLKKVHQKGTSNVSINIDKRILVDMENPHNSFERELISCYKEELNKVGTIYQ